MKTKNVLVLIGFLCLFIGTHAFIQTHDQMTASVVRQCISINQGWSIAQAMVAVSVQTYGLVRLVGLPLIWPSVQATK
jgi:hypothetical protein